MPGTTVALVPARGGSRGVPSKNLRTVGGRSLVGRAVDTALAVGAIDRVVVSSDSKSILEAGSVAGAESLPRPDHLVADDTPTMAVVEHALEELGEVETLVVLQPTSPLRSPEDVEMVLGALADAPAATTVTVAEHHPSWHFELGTNGELEPLLGWEALASRRQDGPRYVRLTGAVYAARAAHLLAGNPLVGPQTAGVLVPTYRSIDIDEELDLVFAEFLLDRTKTER